MAEALVGTEKRHQEMNYSKKHLKQEYNGRMRIWLHRHSTVFYIEKTHQICSKKFYKTGIGGRKIYEAIE